MEEDIAIRVSHIRKGFRSYSSNYQRLQHMLLGIRTGKYERVLRDVSFEVKKGERVGLIGMPGSGKTTLMRIMAGIVTADSGEVETGGEITPFLDSKLGFERNLSGRDNYEVRARLLDWTPEMIKENEEAIFEFAGLTKLKDEPMKTYRSNLPGLLGFAISTVVKPDIMLMDEKIRYGTNRQALKCTRRLKRLLRGGSTLVMTVTEGTMSAKICRRGIVLHKGTVVFDGPFEEAMEYFRENCRKQRNRPGKDDREAVSERAPVQMDDDQEDDEGFAL